MKNLKSKAFLLPTGIALLLAMAGCGSGQGAPVTPESEQVQSIPEPADIFPRMLETINAATSVSMAADLASGTTSMKFKVSGDRDGSNSLAEVTADGATINLLTIDAASYVKADEEFFAKSRGEEAAATISAQAGGKWISVEQTRLQFGSIAMLNVGKMLDSLGSSMMKEPPASEITDSSVVDLNGTRTFKYTAEKGIYWIAAEGEPYLLQTETLDPTGKNSGTMTFNEWNAVAPHIAPAAGESITIPGI